ACRVTTRVSAPHRDRGYCCACLCPRRLLHPFPTRRSSDLILDAVVKENSQNLSGLLNNLVTVAKPLADKPTTLQALYILYPYLLEGGYSTLVPDDPNTPEGVFDADKYDYNAAFGLVFTLNPGTCGQGYIPNDQWRSPADLSDAPFDTTVDCTDDDLVHRTPSKSVVQESTDD